MNYRRRNRAVLSRLSSLWCDRLDTLDVGFVLYRQLLTDIYNRFSLEHYLGQQIEPARQTAGICIRTVQPLATETAYMVFVARSATSSGAAARSANSKARSCRIRPAGIESSPLSSRGSIDTFSLPVTSQRMRRARLIIG